jgi:cell division protein FtsQ
MSRRFWARRGEIGRGADSSGEESGESGGAATVVDDPGLAAVGTHDAAGEWSDVKIVPLDLEDQPPAEPSGDVDRPDDSVLDELSQAFDPAASSDRTTIAIGGDDDVPDAVYLDDAAVGEDGSGGTVFIDDDGTGDAIAPKDATGTGIEPRVRQRRIGVRRSAARRRIKWVAAGLGILLILIAGLAVLGSSLFAIDSVQVVGAQYTDPETLADVIEDLEGTPVLLADTDAAERRLESIPWVEDARVTTQFPDGATIELRERIPLAALRGEDGGFRVLDREGRVLAVIEGRPVAYVEIVGAGQTDLASGDFAETGYAAASSLVTKLSPSVRPRVESIRATPDGGDIRLFLTTDDGRLIEVRLGAAVGDNDQIEKLVRLERLLDDLEDSDTTVIDVATAEATEL